MEQIGKVFRQLRESRKYLAETSNWGQFRRLCYLALKQVRVSFRWKKFLFALENISASVEGNPLSSERFSV